MRRYRVRFTPLARRQLEELYNYIATEADPETAFGYVERIERFCAGFEAFPERGTLRDDIQPGLRLVGFERRVTVAFTVAGDEVRILSVLYAGRALPPHGSGPFES